MKARRETGWKAEELLDGMEAGDGEAIATGLEVARRILELAEDMVERGEVPLSQLFCFIRDTAEKEKRAGPFADWLDDWRAQNPHLAADETALTARVLSKLQAKARDGSLTPWCKQRGLNPVAVAEFAFGGQAHSSRRQ